MALFSIYVVFKERKSLFYAYLSYKRNSQMERACKIIENLITSCSYAKIGFKIFTILANNLTKTTFYI
jgi:hypothetical protein